MAAACSATADHHQLLRGAWGPYVSALLGGELPPPAALLSAALGHDVAGRLDVLASIAYDQVEAQLQSELIQPFWQQLEAVRADAGAGIQLLQPLQDLAHAVNKQAQHLQALSRELLLGLLQQWGGKDAAAVALLASLCDRHRMAVTSLLMATAPFSLPGLLQQFYHAKLHELCEVIQQLQEQEEEPSDAMSEDMAPAQSPSAGGQPQSNKQQPEPDPLPVLGAAWADELAGVSRALEQLGLGAASEEAYRRVINSYVLERLRGLATQDFDQAVLPRAQHLVCAGPLAFLRLVLGGGGQQDEAQAQKLQEWQLRLTYLMLETLGALRSADMFAIVIDYPDSAPALQDLAVCLQHTSLAGHFAASFKAALQQRLLHAGAATSDIIHTYVSTIRAMQHVDPSGLLLEVVSEPIRAYLRSRSDTIRCIVSMLTDDHHTSDSAAGAGAGAGAAGGGGGGTLLEELLQHQQQQQSYQQQGFFTGGGGGGSHPGGAGGGSVGSGGAAASASAAAHASYNWCVGEAEGDEAALRLLEALEAGPASAAAAPAGQEQQGPATTLLGLPLRPPAAASAALAASSLGGGIGGGAGGGDSGDVVSSLIGIYGGPLLFMAEYRRMLADRLLAKADYDCVREIRTLELLKIRFGDAGLHACEVLLKDMADSKRLDTNIRALRPPGGTSQPLPPAVDAALSRCRATVCSYLFWPELPEHDLTLPPDLSTALEVYAERFRHLKAPRKLHWRHTLGLVELSLTVGDSEPLDFRVTPVHAAMLLQFADNNNDSGGGGAAAAAAAAGQQQPQAASGPGWKTATQLSAALGVPVPVVRRKAMFWVAAGVFLERRGPKGEVVYSRATRIDPSRIASREATDYSWQEASGAAASAEDRLVAEMGPFENFISGMLTNFGSMAPDRMHNMLRVFVVGEPKYESRTQEQLAAFLQLLVEQGKLEVKNGVYSNLTGAAT